MPVNIDYHKCIGCRACFRECPPDCFEWDEERDMPYMAYPNECWHCGICEHECPEGAIDVSLPPQCWTEVNKRYLSPWGRTE